jgi:chemotaxis signal transduction protein/outer membrane protein OmpA-like peptidoglycan-associated protein
MPAVTVDSASARQEAGAAWDVDPESTKVVAVPASKAESASREGPARAVAAPAASAEERKAVAPPAAKAAAPPAAKAEAPPAAKAEAPPAARAEAPPAAKAEAPPAARAVDAAKSPPVTPAKTVEPPNAPPVAALKAAPPASPAKALEAPTAPPAPAATRGLEAKTAPPAATGWLAPIIEPGTSLDDIERHEAAVLFDFDSDLLLNTSEQHPTLAGQSTGESICTFWLGPDCYGLDVQLVSEVLLVDDILPVPWAPPALLGLFNSRGRIVPVVSLAALLGLPAAPSEPHVASQASPAILIKAESLVAAALIDRPGLVVQIERGSLTPTERGSAEPWVKGHLRPDERSHPAVTLLDPACLVQRFLDMSRFPDIRTCLGSGGQRPARAPSAKNSGGEIS